MAYQPIIYTPLNSGSGDSLPAGAAKINANFAELYAALATGGVLNGPVCGTKYADLKAAVMYCSLAPLANNQLYYIGSLGAGVPSGGNFIYSLQICRNTSPTGHSTLAAGSITITSATIKSGIELLPFTAVNQAGLSGTIYGVTGFLVVDWSKLSPGLLYTGYNFSETGLFGICSPSGAASAGGGGTVPPLVDGTKIDGTGGVYNNTLTTTVTITLDDIANVPGPFIIKNSASGTVIILAYNGTQTMDGYTQIQLDQHEWIQFFPNYDKHLCIGVYSGSNP